MKSKRSVKAKMIFSILLLVCLSLAAVGIISNLNIYNSTITTLNKSMTETATVSADVVTQKLNALKSVVSQISRLPQFTSPDVSDSQRIAGHLIEFLKHEVARGRLPALKAAAADLEQSRQQIALQQREAIPTPSLSYTRVNHRQDGRYGVVGVSVDIPLFDRKQGAIDKARADEMQAQYKQEAAEVAAQAELWRSLQQLRMANDALAAFESDALSQLDQLRRMAQDSYQLGKSNVLELIDVLDTLRERRMDHLDLVKDMLDAEWRLRVASGNMPQVQP